MSGGGAAPFDDYEPRRFRQAILAIDAIAQVDIGTRSIIASYQARADEGSNVPAGSLKNFWSDDESYLTLLATAAVQNTLAQNTTIQASIGVRTSYLIANEDFPSPPSAPDDSGGNPCVLDQTVIGPKPVSIDEVPAGSLVNFWTDDESYLSLLSMSATLNAIAQATATQVVTSVLVSYLIANEGYAPLPPVPDDGGGITLVIDQTAIALIPTLSNVDEAITIVDDISLMLSAALMQIIAQSTSVAVVSDDPVTLVDDSSSFSIAAFIQTVPWFPAILTADEFVALIVLPELIRTGFTNVVIPTQTIIKI